MESLMKSLVAPKKIALSPEDESLIAEIVTFDLYKYVENHLQIRHTEPLKKLSSEITPKYCNIQDPWKWSTWPVQCTISMISVHHCSIYGVVTVRPITFHPK